MAIEIIGEGPFTTEQLDAWDCPAPFARHNIMAEFYGHVDGEDWRRLFWMKGVIVPSSPHEATEGRCVQVLMEGEQHGAVQLTGHDTPRLETLERGEQHIELSDGSKRLARWVMHCLRPQDHDV